jgi:hypothetical protein
MKKTCQGRKVRFLAATKQHNNATLLNEKTGIA